MCFNLKILTCLLGSIILLSSSLRSEDPSQQDAKLSSSNGEPKIDFALQIRPLLSDHCFTCHGPDAGTRETDLRFDTEAGAKQDLGGYFAIVPGKADESELLKRLLTEDESEKMPPPATGRDLSKQEVDLIRQWINQGAPWAKHWSFVKAQKEFVPEDAFKNWSTNFIDRFIGQKISDAGLQPNETANKETLIRRVTLDLTGLPPTPAEIDDFLSDQSKDAFEKVVDRLLASPHYGEHMAWSWLDAARYADTNGYQQDRTRTMWYWRDWVVKALNNNMSFDQFTIEQLAGDLLPDATLEQKIATGFNRNHMLNGEGGRIAEESRVEYVINRVDTTSTVWLGLTAGCARCHDHKYDPISQKEFYQLFAFFNNVKESGRVDRGGNAAPVVNVPSSSDLVKSDQLNKQLATLRQKLEQLSQVKPEEIDNWIASTRKKLEEHGSIYPWHIVQPVEYQSSAGADIQLEDKQTLLVSGKNPEKDDYEITATVAPGNYQAIRLQALSHPKFTHQGLARSDSGNFVLTSFEVQLDGQDVKLASAQADHEQGIFKVENTLDNNPNTGWAVLKSPKQMQETRSAIFQLAAPLHVTQASKIKFTLRHQSVHKFHNIGRFQISLSEDPQAKFKNKSKLPENILAAVLVEKKSRTTNQQKMIADYIGELRKEPVKQQIKQTTEEITKFENSLPKSMVMEELDQPRQSHLLIRGQWDKKGESVSTGTPAQLHPFSPEYSNNRLGLAQWIISPENPLTARVTVNRIWQQFFGQGLVKTSEDFGSQGERPSHPALLDHLAAHFIESGWDMKQLVKTIVLSSTYQQSSKLTQEKLSIDAENRLLARYPRYRLSAPTIRDQALAVSGLLNDDIGGAPVFPYQPPGVWQDFSLGKITYKQDHGDKLYRRTLYTFWRRSVGPTMLFDTSARQVCVVKPSLTNTPLHALTLMNETGFVEASRVFAQRVLKSKKKLEEQIKYAFRLATARFPDEQELIALTEIHQTALTHYQVNEEAVNKILQVGEYKSDPALKPIEIAAMTSVTSVILNLDEVITKE